MGRYIGEALESVASQAHTDWEIIVVDDCAPDDGTAEIVATFAAKHPDHRIEFIRHEVNTGVSGARNTAIKASKGEFLAFLDPDDTWKPEYLEKMLIGLKEADICACSAIRIDDNGNILGTYIYGVCAKRVSEFPSSIGKGNFFNPSFTVIREDVIKKVGFFDETIHFGEEWDYWLRSLAQGFKFNFILDELCYYRQHLGAVTTNASKLGMGCIVCLSKNIPRFDGDFRKVLEESLFRELLRDAQIKLHHGKPNWLLNIIKAIRMRPYSLRGWKRLVRLIFMKLSSGVSPTTNHS
jgi:glycosyltransferase involved in cell wall biosynthesis